MTNHRRIPLHEPEFDLNDGIALLETLRSTWVSTGGPYVDRFEKEFAQFVGTRYAVSVCNGTIALQLMLESLRHEKQLSQSFDVIVPTLTFMATAAAVIHAGGHPVFVDNSETQMNMSRSAVESTIRECYRWDETARFWINRDSGRPLLAVMAAHIMGWTGAALELSKLCKDMQITYVEDAAESLGTFDQNEHHAGSQSEAAAFSFNGNKILTTGGGGMLVTNQEKLAKLAKHLSTTAKTNGLRYEHDMVGHNFRMVNILAALGCSQLEKLQDRLVRKKSIYESYEQRLQGYSEGALYQEPGIQGNHWLVNIVFNSQSIREATLQKLNELGVEARPLWTPLHLQKAFRHHTQSREQFPNAENFWKKTLSLPSSPGLKEADLAMICDVIKTIS
jgi:perosamine synthetase